MTGLWRYRIGLWPTAIAYRLRRLRVEPASPEDRCIMGAPVHPSVHCPRYALGDGLWCRKHQEQGDLPAPLENPQ